MVAYEFYWTNGKGKEHLIGILPERRKNPQRITRESILNWVKMVLRDSSGVDFNSIYFTQVDV
ncbi:MAG: hypothetical protein A2156_13025 [Deltaproteobacteria bacterium RBG_16_48_10]|nr:MAG: hypothetical protein A2156_13025 [Deltaproteobacteria bacterium RBG_16_48_10]